MAREWLAAFRSTGPDSTLYVNTFAVKIDMTGPDITELGADAAADEISDWLLGSYLDCLHPQYTVNALQVKQIGGGGLTGEKALAADGNLVVSGMGDIKCPKELCLVLTLRTDHPGRSGRGRVFLPSPRNVGFQGDTLGWDRSSAYWTGANNLGDELLDGETFTHGGIEYHASARVWSRADGVTRDMTAYTPRFEYHFLRSRRSAP